MFELFVRLSHTPDGHPTDKNFVQYFYPGKIFSSPSPETQKIGLFFINSGIP